MSEENVQLPETILDTVDRAANDETFGEQKDRPTRVEEEADEESFVDEDDDDEYEDDEDEDEDYDEDEDEEHVNFENSVEGLL